MMKVGDLVTPREHRDFVGIIIRKVVPTSKTNYDDCIVFWIKTGSGNLFSDYYRTEWLERMY